MDKERKYKNLHKLLYLREGIEKKTVTRLDFKYKVLTVATKFLYLGHSDLDKEISDDLIGIVNMGENLPFDVTRSILLNMMDRVDRSE